MFTFSLLFFPGSSQVKLFLSSHHSSSCASSSWQLFARYAERTRSGGFPHPASAEFSQEKSFLLDSKLSSLGVTLCAAVNHWLAWRVRLLVRALPWPGPTSSPLCWTEGVNRSRPVSDSPSGRDQRPSFALPVGVLHRLTTLSDQSALFYLTSAGCKARSLACAHRSD